MRPKLSISIAFFKWLLNNRIAQGLFFSTHAWVGDPDAAKLQLASVKLTRLKQCLASRRNVITKNGKTHFLLAKTGLFLFIFVLFI